MNWIQENKFLSGFLAVMLIGVGALGFLLLSAKGKYEEALTGYQEKANELSSLVKRPIFPSEKNVEKLVEQRKQVSDKAAELAKALSAQQIPAEEITPAQFQDKLKAAVNATKTKAAQAGKPVKLGEADKPFFLGFDKYETAPPDAAAAVALGRQLKVIDWVVGKLIESGVAEIKSLTRPDLPEESGKGKVDDKKPAAGKVATKVAVRKNPFEVTFLAEQANFKQALNAIVEYKGQFLIPRVVIVKNTVDKGPPKVAAGVTPAPGPPVPLDPLTPPGGNPAQPPVVVAAVDAPSATYIVGEEKVEVRLFLEAAEFTEVAAK